ncbi:hypothetical protein CHS0354_010905 [Potamilus streckersoni]|uniref:Steroid 21-hydroxylase n=1 Tax=Potamilus streckersoni TaxID=2493646 RepID=A0AAE0SSL2_9BIVA|nr:hypothetical protein CHS0354_010905 [Potamilus streckersoni]
MTSINTFYGSIPIFSVTTILFFCVVFLLYLYGIQKPRDVPPGPNIYFPLLGNIPQLTGKDTMCLFRDWRTKYGDVFSVYLGHQLLVIINGYETIKEALVRRGSEFSERPANYLLDKIKNGEGVIFTSGPSWRKQRKLSLNFLQDLGFGRTSFEQNIKEEVQILLEMVLSTKGNPFDIKKMLRLCVSNVMCGIVFGKRFNHDDMKFLTIIHNFDEDSKALGNASVLMNCFPFLHYLPGDIFNSRMLMSHHEIFLEFFDEIYTAHEATLDRENIRDFMDMYILEMKEGLESGKENSYSKMQLAALVGDLFGAGTETTMTTMLWTILYLVYYPEIQEKCYQELENVIGLDQFPTMANKLELPYIEATIMESLRISNATPFAIPHAVLKDTIFKGKRIPRECSVLINLHSIFHDSRVFYKSEQFQPERFLDVDGKVHRPEEFIPFSTGRRMCLGEKVARMELFIFITAMIQKFRFLPQEGLPPPSLKGDLGITYTPQKFKIRAVPRNT